MPALMPAYGDLLHMRVHWQDSTPYGSLLSGRIQETIRQHLHPTTFAQVHAWMEGQAEPQADALVRQIQQERTAGRYKQYLADPAFLHPPAAQTWPAQLTLHAPGTPLQATLPASGLDWQQLGLALQGKEADIPIPLTCFLQDMSQRIQTPVRGALAHEALVVVGHACVSLYQHGKRLWLDPFFLPKQPHYGSWQPLSPLDLPAQQHYVLFTHSHPDHFDPASLLLFPADTVFFVPPCPDGENLLSLDMAFRLRQLGFMHIHTLAWWDSMQLDGFTLTATPFYGEQAVGFSAAPPLLWNHGSTWHVRQEHDQQTFLFLADSGSDPRQHALAFARTLRQQLGQIDNIFGNCRRWRLYPAQYLTSSVPAYLLVTPDAELGIPHTIMLEAHELAAFAEICGARQVFPYAMGGAPWYSELGLGYAHENHLATDFDTDPRAALQGSHIHLRLPPAFRQQDALAGSYRTAAGELLPPQPCTLAEPETQAGDADEVLTLFNPSRTAAAELGQLATLSRDIAVVLAPDVCEFWLPEASQEQHALLRHALLAWLTHYPGSYLHSSRPLSVIPFADNPIWRSLARRLLLAAHNTVLGKDQGHTLAQALYEPPFNHIPSALLREVYTGLTGATPDISHAPTPYPFELPDELPVIGLPTSAEASGLTRQYSHQEIALALLVSKCLHNIWLTQQALGLDKGTEAAFVTGLYHHQGIQGMTRRINQR